MPARIQGDQQEGVGWPKFAGSDLMAAAGVRAESGVELLCTGALGSWEHSEPIGRLGRERLWLERRR